eukprot:1161525-Pelagomonas_calceolata.AAC.11
MLSNACHCDAMQVLKGVAGNPDGTVDVHGGLCHLMRLLWCVLSFLICKSQPSVEATNKLVTCSCVGTPSLPAPVQRSPACPPTSPLLPFITATFRAAATAFLHAAVMLRVCCAGGGGHCCGALCCSMLLLHAALMVIRGTAPCRCFDVVWGSCCGGVRGCRGVDHRPKPPNRSFSQPRTLEMNSNLTITLSPHRAKR